MHLTSRQTVAIGTSRDLTVKIGGVNNERTNAAARVRSVTAKDDSFPRDLVSVATFSCWHTTLRGALSGEGAKRCRNLSRDERFAVCKKLGLPSPLKCKSHLCSPRCRNVPTQNEWVNIFGKLMKTFVLRQEHKGKECDMVTAFRIIQNTTVMPTKRDLIRESAMCRPHYSTSSSQIK